MKTRSERIKEMNENELAKLIANVYLSGMLQGGLPFVSENLMESFVKNNVKNIVEDSKKWLGEEDDL